MDRIFVHEPDRIALYDDARNAVAYVAYDYADPNTVEVTHTFVDGSLRGQGIAGLLMAELEKELNEKGLKARLLCSYAKSWFEKHPEAASLIAPESRPPVIGVTPHISESEDQLSVSSALMDAVTAAGGLPVLLPAVTDPGLLSALLDSVDGVLFSGGVDIDPVYFGECQHQGCGTVSPLRDRMEITLARLAAKRPDKAVFAICRGFQVLNVALGGTIWQDLPGEYENKSILHRQKSPSRYPSHPVTLNEGTLLYKVLGTQQLRVNSLHHQAVRQIGRQMTVSAVAPDGVIEAAEHSGLPYFLGVQWHPERMYEHDDASMALFVSFVEAARKLSAEKSDTAR